MLMHIPQLESDLAAKQEAFRALYGKYSALAEQEKRESTDQERGELQAILDDAKKVKARLDRARGDRAISEEIESLYSKQHQATQPGRVQIYNQAQMKTAGQLWVESEAFTFFKNGLHHSGGSAWRSPSIEVPYASMFATTLTEDPASGGKLLVPQYQPGILPLQFKRLVVADLMASGTADSNSIIYMVETLFTNAAAPVAEGIAKPESALTFDQKTDAVSKIAHWIPVTEEMLEDVAAIRSYIDARLRLGVSLAEEDQLLNGNGTPPNLMGLMNRPGLAAAVARNAGATPPETNMDAIARQISAIATASFIYPDGIVMNPANWFTCQISKDANGHYFGAGPFSALPTATMWGLPVAPTPSIVAGTSLVGAYGTMSQVFRKGGIRVEASNSHQDFFIKNLVAIRAEERLALAVYRPAAFGKVTGLN
jgi:HK97 family phage major capsid protein